MKTSEYWRERFVQLEQAQNQLAQVGRQQIERHYRLAQRELDDQIRVWYQRLADNNEISLAEARRWLSGDELAEFKWDVQEYIKRGTENAIDGQWAKQLENASAKFHISRLEALKIRTQQSIEQLFAKQHGVVGNTLGEVYRSGYYHTAFELQKGFAIGWDIAGIDQQQLEKVLAKPWAVDGRNFSERIWGNKDKLIAEVHTELTRNIMLGQDPQQAIDTIARKMNTSKTNAGRLVMTEEAYFSSLAQRDCFHDLGVEQFEIVATLDSHTSEICQEADGQVRPMSEFEPGVTAPPFHVNCRSTTVPYFDDDFGSIGERAARDSETGKTYYVPADMTYKEWAEAFTEGDKTGLQEVAGSGIIKTVQDCNNFDDLANYLSSVYEIDMSADVMQLDFMAVKYAMQGVETIFSEYLDVGKLINEAVTCNTGVMSCSGKQLTFNPVYFGDVQKITDICREQSACRHWVPNSSLASVGAHEAGHGVEWALIQANPAYSYDFERVLAWNNCSEAKAIISQACKNIKRTEFGKKKVNAVLIQSISRYASKNASETMAEAFADVYANGADANPLSIEIKRLVAEKMQYYKGLG